MKAANLLTLKSQPERQASNLTYTSRNIPEHSPGMDNGWCHLYPLPLLCSRAQVFPGRELQHASSTPVSVAAAYRIPLDHLALVVGVD